MKYTRHAIDRLRSFNIPLKQVNREIKTAIEMDEVPFFATQRKKKEFGLGKTRYVQFGTTILVINKITNTVITAYDRRLEMDADLLFPEQKMKTKKIIRGEIKEVSHEKFKKLVEKYHKKHSKE